ncbi:hypothetical protein HYT57_05595 [Candidatus Woesearchaeota archaeon]|nr:hypothetical protein [Candidatus Woesearchaeota archaeon]
MDKWILNESERIFLQLCLGYYKQNKQFSYTEIMKDMKKYVNDKEIDTVEVYKKKIDRLLGIFLDNGCLIKDLRYDRYYGINPEKINEIRNLIEDNKERDEKINTGFYNSLKLLLVLLVCFTLILSSPYWFNVKNTAIDLFNFSFEDNITLHNEAEQPSNNTPYRMLNNITTNYEKESSNNTVFKIVKSQ